MRNRILLPLGVWLCLLTTPAWAEPQAAEKPWIGVGLSKPSRPSSTASRVSSSSAFCPKVLPTRRA
jgi:hypothetical protein